MADDVKLPDPPLMALAKLKGKGQVPRWYVLVQTKHGPRFQAPAFHAWFLPSRLIVVDHPRNDPAATALIESAHQKK